MELELIDSKPVSNEVIDSFYKYLEQQEKNSEKIEELEYNKSGIITRRKFLQYSALGVAGLGLGLSTEKAEAYLPLLIPVGIALLCSWVKSCEPATGNIIINNQTNTRKTSKMDLELIGSRDLRNKTSTWANYSVPAFRENTYRFKHGPSACVSRNTRTYLHASNGNGDATSDGFILRA